MAKAVRAVCLCKDAALAQTLSFCSRTFSLVRAASSGSQLDNLQAHSLHVSDLLMMMMMGFIDDWKPNLTYAS